MMKLSFQEKSEKVLLSKYWYLYALLQHTLILSSSPRQPSHKFRQEDEPSTGSSY